MEHYVHMEGRGPVHPETTAVLGYRYGQTDYTGDQIIGLDGALKDPNTGLPVAYSSDARNQRSHYGYVGVDHAFRPDLTASVRVGARYTDHYKEPGGDQTEIGPSAQASLQYR